MKGLIQIYCGDGKGKTTAAVGQAVRSAGCGLPVVAVRFLKTEDSGELLSLRRLPGVYLIPCERSFGFFWNMTEEEKKEAAEVYGRMMEKAFAEAEKLAADGGALLVMDEAMAAYNHGLIDRERLLGFLREKPESLEVVMTGRDPAAELLELADYVSEIRKVKHPFDRGIAARKGIEY